MTTAEIEQIKREERLRIRDVLDRDLQDMAMVAGSQEYDILAKIAITTFRLYIKSILK